MESHTTEIFHGQSRYCRTRSNERDVLENKLLQYYGVAKHIPGDDYYAFVFPSGMSAISTIMQALSDKNRSIVVGDELYCDSPKVAKYLAEKGFYKSVIKMSDVQETDDIQLVHLETCSNPSGMVPNYEKLMELKKKHNCIISLDNTWLSGVSYNPFQKHKELVDIVVESTSKYISNGQCIGGMCITKEIHEVKLFSHVKMYGIHVSSQVCNIVSGTLETVEDRISKSSKNTQIVLSQLKDADITYPKDIDSKYPPSIFVINIPIAKIGCEGKKHDKLKKAIKELCSKHNVPFETSFGGSYSKIDSFPKLNDEKNTPGGNNNVKVQLRVYVGYQEDQSAVINLLKDVLK